MKTLFSLFCHLFLICRLYIYIDRCTYICILLHTYNNQIYTLINVPETIIVEIVESFRQFNTILVVACTYNNNNNTREKPQLPQLEYETSLNFVSQV